MIKQVKAKLLAMMGRDSYGVEDLLQLSQAYRNLAEVDVDEIFERQMKMMTIEQETQESQEYTPEPSATGQD